MEILRLRAIGRARRDEGGEVTIPTPVILVDRLGALPHTLNPFVEGSIPSAPTPKTSIFRPYIAIFCASMVTHDHPQKPQATK
jgi:hypothetical protein